MNIKIKSEIAMKAFGAKIGALLKGGEVLELVGDVGAGKTTLAKGIASGLGIDEDVQSPSFTISRVYDTASGVRLAHYDFYRLPDPGIMAAELSEAVNDPRTITLIEWPQVVAGVLPDDRITITISSPSETDRQLTLQAGGPTSQLFLEQLA